MIDSETRATHAAGPRARIKPVLSALAIQPSTYFHQAKAVPARPGPKPQACDEAMRATVMGYAKRYP